MKQYILNDEINESTTRDLMEFINANDGDLQIGISSVGGWYDHARFISHVLNQNKSRITLVAIGNIYSAAFRMFYEFDGVKKMTFATRGMAHHSRQTISIVNTGVADNEEAKMALHNCKKYINPDELKYAEGFLTEKEFRLFRHGKEVWMDFGRMKEIFPKVEII